MLLQTEPLPEALSLPLLAWLERPEFETLITILQSHAFALDVQSVLDMRESKDGLFPDYAEKAKAKAKVAAKYLDMIQILKDLRDGKHKLETHRALPE